MANILKRGNSYCIRVQHKGNKYSMTWTPPSGITAKQTERELQRQVALYEAAVREGQLSIKAKYREVTFREFCNRWLRDYARQNCKQRTYILYMSMSVRLTEAFGEQLLTDIVPPDVVDFLSNLQKQPSGADHKVRGSEGIVSPKTTKNYLSLLSSMLETAVDWGYIGDNPAAHVRPPKQTRPEVRIIDDIALPIFLSELDKRPAQEQAMFALLLHTGIRRGELLGLRWCDIDNAASTMHIVQTVQSAAGHPCWIDTPKTSTSRRVIHISPAVLDKLDAYRREEGKEYTDDVLIFHNAAGGPMCPSMPNKKLQRILQAAGLPHVTLHSLRHTNATLLIAGGVDVRTVSARLGHSTTSTTLNIYTDALSSRDAAAASVIDDVLSGRGQ